MEHVPDSNANVTVLISTCNNIHHYIISLIDNIVKQATMFFGLLFRLC